jgi:hypothetical protein
VLRLIWGETTKERLLQEEILRLRAQVSDLQAMLSDAANTHRKELAASYKEFLDFLRPKPSGPAITSPAPREYPGYRPDTSTTYPASPLWADGEVKTAGSEQ